MGEEMKKLFLKLLKFKINILKKIYNWFKNETNKEL